MSTKHFDPRFPVPPIVDVAYTEPLVIGDTRSSVSVDFIESEPPVTNGLQPPGGIRLVDQIIHTAEDGSRIVDLVIEIDEVAGATDYETRISKL